MERIERNGSGDHALTTTPHKRPCLLPNRANLPSATLGSRSRTCFPLTRRAKRASGGFCRIITLLFASRCVCAQVIMACNVKSDPQALETRRWSQNRGELCVSSFHREHLRWAAPGEVANGYSRRIDYNSRRHDGELRKSTECQQGCAFVGY